MAGFEVITEDGGKASWIEEAHQREVRDLPWRKYETAVMVGYYRISCPKYELKTEQVPQLRTKAPFSQDLEDAVGLAAIRRLRAGSLAGLNLSGLFGREVYESGCSQSTGLVVSSMRKRGGAGIHRVPKGTHQALPSGASALHPGQGQQSSKNSSLLRVCPRWRSTPRGGRMQSPEPPPRSLHKT